MTAPKISAENPAIRLKDNAIRSKDNEPSMGQSIRNGLGKNLWGIFALLVIGSAPQVGAQNQINRNHNGVNPSFNRNGLYGSNINFLDDSEKSQVTSLDTCNDVNPEQIDINKDGPSNGVNPSFNLNWWDGSNINFLDDSEKSQVTSLDTCNDVNPEQIDINKDGPSQEDPTIGLGNSKAIEFDRKDLEQWTTTDDIEPDEIEGKLTWAGQDFHLKQSTVRTSIGSHIIQALNRVIREGDQLSQELSLFQELPYRLFKDQETGKLFIGSPDCHYKPFSKLDSKEKSADINLHRLLAYAIPGVHDGDMGINEQTQQSVLLDIEGTDFSLDGLSKFLRKCQIMTRTPAESSEINNQLFKNAASIFEALKNHLKSNQDYKQYITQGLSKINLEELKRSELIDALEKDSDDERNKIDAKRSVNLFLAQLASSESFSELFLNAQLNRMDTLISIFTSIGEMTKWNALQRGIVVLYPKLLDEQAQLLKQTNIQQDKDDDQSWENSPYDDLLKAKDYFTEKGDARRFTGTLRKVIDQSLPNGYLSPLRVLMLVLKKADETAQI